MDDNRGAGGLGFGGVLFIVFLVLKLVGIIAWSWWWVTSPLWIPFALLGIVLGGIALVGIVTGTRTESRYERERKERQRLARSADRAIYDKWGKPRG